MKPTSPMHIANRQRGTQILEFALVMPLLFFLAFVVSEGAGFVRVHQVINNAAREGAHFLAMPENVNSSDADVKGVVTAYATNNGVDGTKLTIAVDRNVPVLQDNGITSYMSRVTVTYPYPLTYLHALPFFDVPPTVSLKAKAEFKNFYGL